MPANTAEWMVSLLEVEADRCHLSKACAAGLVNPLGNQNFQELALRVSQCYQQQ